MTTPRFSFAISGLKVWVVCFFCLLGCNRPDPLPVLGPYEKLDGNKIYHPVPDFQLLDQNGDTVSTASLKGKLRIVDFFFTSCPSICPKVQLQMLKIREAFPAEEQLVLLSYSIDPKRDTVERLLHYATNLGITDARKWHFLTGDRQQIYDLADDYFNIVVEDASAPGGFDHSGRIVLVDTAGYIRAYANGLNPASVDTLLEDIQQLLNK
ncbi:MAG: SCO family protein [Bacteroidetes bacterium]|nr:MAG: SCO family protein [Bacteroidota bacterium]PTM13848.1 MAG: SCO family protein [Bacteroidota bacterium]